MLVSGLRRHLCLSIKFTRSPGPTPRSLSPNPLSPQLFSLSTLDQFTLPSLSPSPLCSSFLPRRYPLTRPAFTLSPTLFPSIFLSRASRIATRLRCTVRSNVLDRARFFKYSSRFREMDGKSCEEENYIFRRESRRVERGEYVLKLIFNGYTDLPNRFIYVTISFVEILRSPEGGRERWNISLVVPLFFIFFLPPSKLWTRQLSISRFRQFRVVSIDRV